VRLRYRIAELVAQRNDLARPGKQGAPGGVQAYRFAIAVEQAGLQVVFQLGQLLTAGTLRNSASAAALMLPRSATAMKVLSSRICIYSRILKFF
jgi:hypothetical protein